LLGFTPLPLLLLGAIALLSVTYLLLVQAVKTWFYRRHALLYWLFWRPITLKNGED
jgi:P-type Mg2+ transporter